MKLGASKELADRQPDEIIVDARGHQCPVPTLKLRRALERAPAGARLRLIADDPMAPVDVPHFAEQVGLEILSREVVGGTITILVRRRS